MTLTDTAIRNAKPRDRAYKMFDVGGLHVQIAPTGSKNWRMKYRFKGKEKLLSFGPYPLIALKQAREKRDAARLLLLDDLDPSAEKKRAIRERDQAQAITFGLIAEEYLEKAEREGRAQATMKKLRWLVGQTVGSIYEQPISEIESPDVLRTLKSVEANGTYETARRLRSTIGTVFRYGIATGRATHDPAEALKGALIQHRVRSRSAIIDPKELGRLLRKIDDFTGQPGTKHALHLLALIAPRPGELRLAHWSEFDLDEGVWRVPEERMKMRRPHRVPLAPQAIEHLQELRSYAGNSALVLPSSRSRLKPISENTLNAALKRLGYSSDQITAHGFRATFSTFANECGLWSSDAVERALAHVEANDVRRAYVRGEHWDERVRMAAWWADELAKMKAEWGTV